MSNRLIATLLLGLVLVAVVAEPVYAQCSMCRTALENSPEGRRMSASLNRGILLLLAVPYAILGTVGVVVFRAHRRKQAEDRRNNPYIPKS